VFRRSHGSGLLREDIASSQDAHRLLRVYQAHAQSVGEHRHRRYDGAAHVFTLALEPGDPVDGGWASIVTGPLHPHELPGEPGTFLEPENVAPLGAAIAAAVREQR